MAFLLVLFCMFCCCDICCLTEVSLLLFNYVTFYISSQFWNEISIYVSLILESLRPFLSFSWWISSGFIFMFFSLFKISYYCSCLTFQIVVLLWELRWRPDFPFLIDFFLNLDTYDSILFMLEFRNSTSIWPIILYIQLRKTL